ncbi:hypothetical protein HanPI659440_Chr11g0429031 [Helianthus annuus]|nr:hypothetical protein HanPI659440_Chr11g0429031 [Helianthus annuus]
MANLAVSWWMLENIENLCDIDGFHPESPWTCTKFKVTFDACVIWGLIDSQRLFGTGGLYRILIYRLYGLVLLECRQQRRHI